MKDAGLPEEKTVPASLMWPVVSLLLQTQRYVIHEKWTDCDVMHEKWTDCDYDKLKIFMVICDTV